MSAAWRRRCGHGGGGPTPSQVEWSVICSLPDSTGQVRAVEEGALPTSRFKFFYKSVEFLPGALDAQVADDLFSLAALSPAWLYGQAGQRSMWAEVRPDTQTQTQTQTQTHTHTHTHTAHPCALGLALWMPWGAPACLDVESRGSPGP